MTHLVNLRVAFLAKSGKDTGDDDSNVSVSSSYNSTTSAFLLQRTFMAFIVPTNAKWTCTTALSVPLLRPDF